MIHALLKSEFNKAVKNPENINDDGEINWNFVDSDCYMSGVPKFFKDDTDYYAHWNDLADEYELNQAADRLEVLKTDYLGVA